MGRGDLSEALSLHRSGAEYVPTLIDPPGLTLDSDRPWRVDVDFIPPGKALEVGYEYAHPLVADPAGVEYKHVSETTSDLVEFKDALAQVNTNGTHLFAVTSLRWIDWTKPNMAKVDTIAQ